MTLSPPAAPRQRLASLDAFRGLTIAGMILVNNPGSWSSVYGPLRHAEWHGWTPTDLVFPFFLFIVGVAMAFSFRRRLESGADRLRLLAQVVRRTIIIFALGLIMAGFPDFRLIGPYILVILGVVLLFKDRAGGTPARAWACRLLGVAALAQAGVYLWFDQAYFTESHLRIPGVLQRIAVCYFVVSLIAMTGGTAWRIGWVVAILAGYWFIVARVPPPEGFTATVTGPEGLLHEWVDMQFLSGHVYRERPDPEGILSTAGALGTVLLGLLAGRWLQAQREPRDKVIGLFFAANVALVLAAWMNCEFPINKKIWTSSYVVLTAGLAAHFLAMCYWLIDVRGVRRWASPFIVFGTNAIVVYVASSLGAKLLARKWELADGSVLVVKSWIYEHLLASWAEPHVASLLYPLIYVTLWGLLLVPLYRRRIFVKI